MQRNDSLRQTGLTVLTWILAILILCGAGTGAGIAFADEVDSWDDSDVWDEANGNATATLQVCDLITQEWTKMVTWDLGYPSERILTKNLAGFLENYDTKYCGSVRSANFSNIRGLDAKSGEWVAANSVNFTLNNGVDDFSYVGSYQVGADDSSYYAVTSGVKDLCKPTENMSFSVKNAPSDCPY